jgi:hypothetical protein
LSHNLSFSFSLSSFSSFVFTPSSPC